MNASEQEKLKVGDLVWFTERVHADKPWQIIQLKVVHGPYGTLVAIPLVDQRDSYHVVLNDVFSTPSEAIQYAIDQLVGDKQMLRKKIDLIQDQIVALQETRFRLKEAPWIWMDKR